MFDFSGYPEDSVYYDDSNKKALGKMKNEFNGSKMLNEFVELRSKMYSLSSYDGWELNKAKAINLKPRHQEYVDVLFGKKVARHKMKSIQSKSHKIGT